MNKTEPRDFYINAAISSKSQKFPGVLFVAACADISLFGNMSVHTSNTCESTKIITGRNSSRSMYNEYQSFFVDVKQKILLLTDKNAANKMNWFIDNLEKFMKQLNNFLVENENIRSGLTRVIYPSGSGKILKDLKENLIGKMKSLALSSSGKNDADNFGLITDAEGMNVAKLNGAEELNYNNGSGLVSWMPTGAQLKRLTGKLNSLLGYTSDDLVDYSEYFFSYVLQTFMNVIFVNNPNLSELDRRVIVNNYKKLLKDISNEIADRFESYERAEDKKQKEKELGQPTKFIKFLLNQICQGPKLKDLHLETKENQEKYIASITGITSFLCHAQHPNQVLVEQWFGQFTMGDAFCGKNNVLYLPLYKILQRFIEKSLFKFENDKDKSEFKQMLHFMANLSGKFRFKQTQFNLSSTKEQTKYEFGAQITTKGKYRVSTEYNTDISYDYFQELTLQIIEFEEFEKKVRAADYTFNNDDINQIIKYLLDGRYFSNDVIAKILQDKKFSNEFIEQAKKTKIKDQECCYQSVYVILINDYFDLLNQDNYNKYIDKNWLTHANLIRYFNNGKHKNEIVDVKTDLIFELELFDNLDAETINSFLKDEDEKKKSKMLGILKLAIGRLEKKKLNKLNFGDFDNELLNAVVLSRISDINNNKMKEIDFKNLNLDAQNILFKKMADNDFEDFDFDRQWNQVSVDVFKSASIEEWRKFVFNKIPKPSNYHEKANNQKIISMFCQRREILQLMPVNILSLFDTNNTFFNFFDECFDCWSTEQILTFGRCRNVGGKQLLERELRDYNKGTRKGKDATDTEKSKTEIENQLDQLIKVNLKELENKIKKDKIQLNKNALSTFISLQSFFQQINDPSIKNSHIISDSPKDYHVKLKEILLKFFKTHLLDNKNNEDNINQCLKYVFSNCQSNYFLAMIIMEEFILLNGKFIDKNNDVKALSEISKKIQSALDWHIEAKRKEIIKNLFQFIPKINELMCACDKMVVEDSKHSFRFMTLLNIYKSFLNKILSLYPNDIEKDDVKKIPVYFLENSELIKQFCRICGDRVQIDCFSEILDSVNSAEVINDITESPDKMHKFKKINSILKIIDVADSIEEIEKESLNLDKDDLISNFMLGIERTALLICFGYSMDQPGNSIETHLSQYDKDGKFDYQCSNSVLRDMFKKLCNKNIEVHDFIQKYNYKSGQEQKDQLEEIIKSKIDANDFSKFEEFILPLIEQDYKKMDFVAFVDKYDLLRNAIGVENIDKRMINIAFDFAKGKLSFEKFIYKYYVLPKNENEINENEIINPEMDDYHIKELKDEDSQNILSSILINDAQAEDVMKNADRKTIEKLYKNLLPKSKNMTNKKEFQQMYDSVKQYLNHIKIFKQIGNFGGDTNNLAKILFTEEERDAAIKANKFKTMINTYTKENKNNWGNFAEIYILQHISLQNMKRYIELKQTYQKILDLNAQAANLEDVVRAFYKEINKIDICIEVINKCYSDINSFIYYPCLLDIQKKVMDPGFINNFKTLFQGLVAINKIYANDQAVKICKKYEHLIQDKSGSSIKKFFSSMVNFVHFIKDYRKLAKILLIDMYEESAGSEEEKISKLAYKMFDNKSGRDFNPNDNFTFTFVYCLDELEKTLELTYQEYQNKKNENTKKISEDKYMKKQQALRQIYDKYKKYGNRFFTPRDVEIMCQKSDKDEDSDFQKDFKLVINTLEEIVFLKKKNVFKSCVDDFKCDILANYEKGFESGTTLEKFIDLGYRKYFSDEQIYNLGVINRFDVEINDICTPKAVIKKLPKIASDESTKKLDQTSEDLSLRPGDKLDYIIASGNSGAICTDTMRKLFWHMDYRKLKTFVGDYSFKDFKGENKKIASFGAFLQNALIGAIGDKSFGFKSNKTTKQEKDKDIKEQIGNANEKNTLIEYNKMSVSQKFIFGECFFGGMFRSICQINKLKEEKKILGIGNNDFYNKAIYDIEVEKELDELINKIKCRVLSICQNQSVILPMNKNKLALIQVMPNKKSFNASLEELIARAFLSAHIYAYSGHIDGNGYDQSLLNFGNDVFDRIISMLSRSTEHDKFQNIEDIKKWVDESSLKYFIRGTFNFKEIPENELSSHQMELAQNDLIAKYNARILNHILSKTGDKVSAFEVFEKIYLNDENKVIYRLDSVDFVKLVDLLHEKVVMTAKSKEDVVTLLKFLKKVETTEYIPDGTRDKLFDCLLKCAKSVKWLDENGKFVDIESLRSWVENVVLVFAVDNNINYLLHRKIFMYMTDHIGKNISVMDVINILKETDDNKPNSGLVSSLSSCCDQHFVNHLFGQKETQFISTENSKNLDKNKLEDMCYFLDKIGRLQKSDLLNLFPILDVINEKEKLISTDSSNGTKKFVAEDGLQKFVAYEIIDDNKDKEYNEKYKTNRRMAIELWKFLYAISRIPKNKTLLDVVKKFEDNDKKIIFDKPWEYSPEVFASAVQAIYDCLSKEKDNINESNKPDYINFLIRFFTNIKICMNLDLYKEIKQNVLETVGKIFNLFQSQELVEHISDIQAAFFGDKADGTSMLYSIFCKSIENMGNDDITNGNLLKVLEMLESLENICEFDFNNLKNVLNEKIKTVMSNDKDSQKMANDILSIVSGKKISSLLDLSPCLDVLNSENLFVSNNNPTQKFFGNLELLTNFIKNGVPTDNKDCNNKWIRFKYAMQRIPKNITVINALQEIKQNHGDIWNFNFPDLPGNLYANDFCKDICSRIQTEVNSMSQDNEKLFETVDVLIEFFKKITLLDKKNSKINDCFKKNWEDIVKDKNTNNESFIAFSIIDTLKILLSKYKFNDVNDVNTFFEQIKKILKELKLDSKEDAGTNIFVPTVLSALNNSDLNIFLLLEYLCHQYCKKMGDKSSVCHCALQNKDILNKLSDMFKQQIEKLEKEEIANVKFPYYFDHNYEKSGIKFLVQQFVVNGDMNSFQSVVHLALRICCCNITEDKLNIKKCKIVGNGEKYNWDKTQKEQIVQVDSWLYQFFHIFDNMRSELTDYQLGILQKMALEYLIDTLGKDIKIFDVLNKLIDETKDLGKYNISANDKVDEATTLSKEMSKTLVDKMLSESFPEEKDKDEDENKGEEENIKIFEADKKIRCASIFVKLMRFKIDDNEEKRLFNELRAQQKKQKLEYEEAKKKKEEEKRRKEEEEKKKKEEEEKQNDKKHNENNNPEDKKNTKVNAELKKDINENNKRKEEEEEERRQNNLSKPNDNNTIDNKENNENNNPENKKDTKINNVENTINQNSITEKAKQIENPINKKNILIKLLAWLLTSCLVLLCIYFFIQAAIANAFITLILTIIFVVASILLTIYLPNKKEPNINTIKMPLNEENNMYNDVVKSNGQPEKQIIEEERK